MAIKEFCRATPGTATTDWVFFIGAAEGTGLDISGTRVVSFFGPKDGESGAGITDADNCGENEGGVTCGSRTGNWIRTVSFTF